MMQLKISIVAAVARDRVEPARWAIGRDNRLPWRLPDDLREFRRRTVGGCLLMGRKTFESLGAALVGRKHIVLSRSEAWVAQGAAAAHTIDEALAEAQRNHSELFVIGGAQVYAQLLPLATRMLLTEIDWSTTGDAHFPTVQWERWDELARRHMRGMLYATDAAQGDDTQETTAHEVAFDFVEYRRKSDSEA